MPNRDFYKREIILPHELIEPLSHWHNGMDAIYALHSWGSSKLVSLNMIEKAREELERDLRKARAKGTFDDDPEALEELEMLIGELSMIESSPREFSASESGTDMEEDEYEYDADADDEEGLDGLGAGARGQLDETAGDELQLFIDNDSQLYHSQTQSIHKNLEKKIANGTYDPVLAIKLWRYLVDAGAKKYAKEFASPGDWSSMFTVPTRDYVAKNMSEEWYNEYRIQHGLGDTSLHDSTGFGAGLGMWDPER